MSDLSKFGVTREEVKLSNGIRVILFKKPSAPISMVATFMAGSRFDPVGKEGLAHFTEHMMMSGTPSFPSKEKISEFVANMGGYKNAFTSYDILAVDLAMAGSDDMEPFLRLLSEILTKSLFDEKIIEKERGAILSELDMSLSNPMKSLGRITNQLVFQNTPVAHSILGTKESIESISRQDIIDFYHTHINSSNLAITLAGDIDINELKVLLEKYLVELHPGSYFEYNIDLPLARDQHIVCESFKGENVNLEINFRTGSILSSDSPALKVLGAVLGGGGGTGALIKKLRYQKGLVYHAGAGVGLSIDRGCFGADASFSKKNLKEVIENICIEIKRLKTEGPTDNEMTLVKNRVTKSEKRHLQSTDSWVNAHYARSLFYPDLVYTVEDSIREFNAVTLSEVISVAQKYLTNNNWYLSATGNIEESDLKSIVLDF